MKNHLAVLIVQVLYCLIFMKNYINNAVVIKVIKQGFNFIIDSPLQAYFF